VKTAITAAPITVPDDTTPRGVFTLASLCEKPAFLWKRVLAYKIVKRESQVTFILSRFSQNHRTSMVRALMVLATFGALGFLIMGWLVVAVLSPLIAAGFGWLEVDRLKSFARCRIKITPKACVISNSTDQWELPHPVEVRLQKHWKRAENSSTTEGD